MRRCWKYIKDNKNGTTMVEVLVAFTILLVFMGAFINVVKFSGNMYVKSMDYIKANEKFDEDYYTNSSNENKEVVPGESFSLTLDQNKTSHNNASSNGSISLPKITLKKFEEGGLSRYYFESKKSNN